MVFLLIIQNDYFIVWEIWIIDISGGSEGVRTDKVFFVFNTDKEESSVELRVERFEVVN